ncbi:macro domain-containing protein [Herbidospora sp. RD11066]
MARIQVGVLGPTIVRNDDDEVRLRPYTTKLLLRLVAAEGESVSTEALYRDIWGDPVNGRMTRAHRTEVQKRILELRKALDDDTLANNDPLKVLHTEQLLAERGSESAYRLTLDAERLDLLEFADLVNRAAYAAPAMAVALLTKALGLWRGRPLADIPGAEFARRLSRRLTDLYTFAQRELIRAHLELGHPDLALPIAEHLVRELPDDASAAEHLSAVRTRLRERDGRVFLRREFGGLRVTLVIQHGDLFAEDDANLVVGFSDTFDTATDDDVVIAGDSVQGQLLHRVYAGDRATLDRHLRNGLRGVERLSSESREDKPRGKRTRYPIGTVVPLHLPGRRIFAVAYSRQGNDLVAQSSPADLRHGLDALWASVAVRGLYKPVAIPVIGSGLARVAELSREQLVIMIADSFLTACRRRRTSPELRIVVRSEEQAQIRLDDVERFIETLDHDGRGPHA